MTRAPWPYSATVPAPGHPPSEAFEQQLFTELERLAVEYKLAKAQKEATFIAVQVSYRRLELLRDLLALDGTTVELPQRPQQQYEGGIRVRRKKAAAAALRTRLGAKGE